MMEQLTADQRKVFVYQLLPYKSTLCQMLSFRDNIDQCNFTTYNGWKGKTYVDDNGHGVAEFRPVIRGIDMLDICYLRPTDYVVLTEEQMRDFILVSGMKY